MARFDIVSVDPGTNMRGTSAYPAAATSIDAENCLVTGLRACRQGVDLVVFEMGVDTNDTTKYAVDAAPCRTWVSDAFFSANFGGNQTTTTYTCTSASVDAAGLHVWGCASMNGVTMNIPNFGPAPTPVPTATPCRGTGVRLARVGRSKAQLSPDTGGFGDRSGHAYSTTTRRYPKVLAKMPVR